MKTPDFFGLGNFAAAATAAAFLFSHPQARAGEQSRPNVLFILADDMGYADLGCYGQEKILTPRLDRFARESTRFTQCYAGAPVCAPSRCVLITGKHTGHGRIRENSPRVGGEVESFGEGSIRLSLTGAENSVASTLHAGGYATGAAGKWGIAEPESKGTPNLMGFDQWLGYLNNNHAQYYYTDYLWKNGARMPIPENAGGKRGAYSNDLFADFALDFIRQHRSGPFFLYLPFTIPHSRMEVPSMGVYADKPWPEEARICAAMITRLDDYVGRILDELDRLRLTEKTVVFFASDNGEPKKPYGELFRSSANLRDKKGSVYEGGMRVPMIVRWPGHVPAGRVDSTPWGFVDVFPTLVSITGAKAPDGLDGLDVSPTLFGRPQPELSARYLYWEFPRDRLWQAVRHGRWKGVRHGMDSPLELYDLSVDESETRNVAAAHPEVVADLEHFLASARVPSPNWPVN